MICSAYFISVFQWRNSSNSRRRRVSSMLLFLLFTMSCSKCGVFKEVWTYGDRLRFTHNKKIFIWNYADPQYFVRTTQLVSHPGHEQRRVCISCHSTYWHYQRQYFSYVGWHVWSAFQDVNIIWPNYYSYWS